MGMKRQTNNSGEIQYNTKQWFFNQNLRICSIRGLGFPRFVHAKRKPHVSIFYIAWSDFLSVHKSFVPRVDDIFLETSSVPSLFALKVVRYLPLINRIRNPQICTRDCSINQFWALQRLPHALNPPVQKFRNSTINFLWIRKNTGGKIFFFSFKIIKMVLIKFKKKNGGKLIISF